MNIALSIGFNIVFGISMTHIGRFVSYSRWSEYLRLYLFTLPVPIFGLLFTLSSLLLLSESSRYHSAAKYNIALNLLAYPIWYLVFGIWPGSNVALAHILDTHVYYLPIPILLTFSTMILAHCCNRPLLSCSGQSCCCNLPKVEYGALVCSDLDTAYVLDADGKPIRVPQYEEVGRSIELVDDTEEAKAVEEELVELMTDQIERDTQQIEIADADCKPDGVQGHEEVVHSMEVAYLIFVIFFTQAKFLENKIYAEIYTVNCQFTQ